jgi:hypothetical protein
MMNLGDRMGSGTDWIGLSQDREKCNEHLGSIKCWETIDWLHNLCPPSPYNSAQLHKVI